MGKKLGGTIAGSPFSVLGLNCRSHHGVRNFVGLRCGEIENDRFL